MSWKMRYTSNIKLERQTKDRRERNMKKTIKTFCLSTLLAFCFAGAAFADGNAFTPLNFEDGYSAQKTTPAVRTAATNTNVKPAVNTAPVAEQTGNTKMQSAILELDNAQVDVRNELLNLKTRYSEIDSKYTLVKNERKVMKKQLKTTEKRIKQIEKAKEKIRKNML